MEVHMYIHYYAHVRSTLSALTASAGWACLSPIPMTATDERDGLDSVGMDSYECVGVLPLLEQRDVVGKNSLSISSRARYSWKQTKLCSKQG